MRRAELRILEELQGQPLQREELAERIGKSRSWISDLVRSLADQHLVEANGRVTLSDTYEASLLVDLLTTYNLEKVLAGKREEVLAALVSGPKTVSELEERGFAASTVYAVLDDLREVGVIKETMEGYWIDDDTLRTFIEARQSRPYETTYSADSGRVVVTSREAPEGTPTAFSAFRRYGVNYYPNDTFVYQGDAEVGREQVLIHGVLCAETRKQMAMCGVFYLRHKPTLETNELWRLAGVWDCVDRWADLLAYLDRRELQQEDLFLPWEEFTALARDYGVYPRGKHPEESLLDGLDEVGAVLERQVDAYLLGGANLILRGLKDSTKDIDVVLGDRDAFPLLIRALQDLGYEERQDLEEAYEKLAPSIVLEKEGFPRWDIFVDVVADALHLTEEMQTRSDDLRQFGNLRVHLLSLTDVFVFKAVTDREGDLEDAALIARQGAVDWRQVLDEVERQDERTDTYFSFAVLDTLDLLVDRYGIEVPIRDQLASYCLETALLLTLDEPKTIEDLRDELAFPDHQIYNKLRKLEEEGAIDVDRTGTLNRYRTVDN